MSFSVSAILPPNSTKLEKSLVAAFCEVLQEKEIAITKNWLSDLCSEEMLVYLAHAMQVDFSMYNALSLPEKRKYIARSMEIHRQKCTLAAMQAALDIANYRISIEEWYQYGGRPHTARLNVRLDSAATENYFDLAKIGAIAKANKNVQTQFSLFVDNTTDTNCFVGIISKTTLTIISATKIFFFVDLLAEINRKLEDFRWRN